MTELAHSPLGGSTLKRWSNCPGSVKRCEGVPNKTSSYAEEGTRAHEIAAYYLRNRKWPDNTDAETIEAVKVYTDAVMQDFEPLVYCWVEKKFSLSLIHPNLFGTADCVVYNTEKKLLRVYDYKHGSGTLVEVQEDGKPNEQLLYYALGAALTLNLLIEEVEIIIVQPRCPHPDGPVRRWRFSGLYLLEFAADLSAFAKATEEANAPLKAGPHCKFCPAAGQCPELHQMAVVLAKEQFSPDFSYDPDCLSKTLLWLPVLEGWIKSVREFAYGEAQQGRVPPGWKLVQKRATRKWRDELQAGEVLLANFGNEEIFSRTLRTPAQVEKLLKDKVAVDVLVEFKSSGYTLAPESDRRESARLDARSEFEVVAE